MFIWTSKEEVRLSKQFKVSEKKQTNKFLCHTGRLSTSLNSSRSSLSSARPHQLVDFKVGLGFWLDFSQSLLKCTLLNFPPQNYSPSLLFMYCYLVDLAEEQPLGISEVPGVSFKGPPLEATRRWFPGIPCVSRGEQLLPMSAGQQDESVDVDHCCDTELNLLRTPSVAVSWQQPPAQIPFTYLSHNDDARRWRKDAFHVVGYYVVAWKTQVYQ